MPTHRPIDCLPLWTLFKLVLPHHEHHLIFYCTSCTSWWHWEHALLLYPCHPTPPTSSPSLAFLFLWLPKKLKDDRMEDMGGAERRWCRRGVLELNAIDEWWEVENETICHMLLVERLVSLERERGGGNKWPVCKHVRLGPCGGIRCPNDTIDHPMSHLTLFDVLRVIISCFIVEGVMKSTLNMLGGI
jgi:hypothetical protein